MRVLPWHEALATGHADLDEQHRELYGLAAEVVESIQDAAWDCSDSLGRLESLLRQHFACEEARMDELGLPRLDQHRARHREIIHRAGLLRRSWMLDPATLGEHIGGFMHQWITVHLMEWDVDLRGHAGA